MLNYLVDTNSRSTKYISAHIVAAVVCLYNVHAQMKHLDSILIVNYLLSSRDSIITIAIVNIYETISQLYFMLILVWSRYSSLLLCQPIEL